MSPKIDRCCHKKACSASGHFKNCSYGVRTRRETASRSRHPWRCAQPDQSSIRPEPFPGCIEKPHVAEFARLTPVFSLFFNELPELFVMNPAVRTEVRTLMYRN